MKQLKARRTQPRKFWLRCVHVPVIMAFVITNASMAQPKKMAPSPVVVTRVIEAAVSTGQRVVGTVNPLRISTIGSAADGRVLLFHLNQGEAVKKGQALAQLRTETLEIELASAKAELELFRLQLEELQNGSRPEEIAEAQANVMGAKASRNKADRQLKRMESLSNSRATSATALDDAREFAESTRYALAASEALFKRIKDGPRVERINQAKSQVELQRQQVRLIEDRIKKHTIVAPFDGFVSAEFTEVGAWITRGDPIAQVIQMDELEIQASATAEVAVQLKRGDAVRVEFPDLPERLLTGTIDRVVPMADLRARTFPVYIRLKNDVRDNTPLLMAGMLARVALPTGERRIMPLVPKDALVLNGSDRAIFVVDVRTGDGTTKGGKRVGTVRRVPVELGIAMGGMIQVQGNIKANELVVVVGNERLLSGTNVIIERTMEPEQHSDLESVSAK